MDAAARDYLLVRSDRRTSNLSALLAFKVAEVAAALPGQGEEILELVNGVWDEAHDEGYEEGKEDGYKDGFDEGEAEGRREAEAEAALRDIRPAEGESEKDDQGGGVPADSHGEP